MRQRPRRRVGVVLVALALAASACGRGADDHGRVAPHFEPGFNLFSPQQDVELGRESAVQIAAELPTIEDPEVSGYLSEVGKRIAAQAPGERFPYEFHVVNLADVNAFALPGGVIFVTRGLLETVRDEGELAGVLAHEISHVALRHGTSQMSKAYIAQTGLGILQEILGGGEGVGNLGDVVAAVGGAGLNTLFLKFGRTAETQADLTGARVMAGVGYDPVEMVQFFQLLEAQGAQRGPEFLHDHPNPGNRARAVEQVRQALDVPANPIVDTDAFRRMKADLKQLPVPRGARPRQVGPAGGGSARPEPPVADLETYAAPTSSYEIAYPRNWDALSNRADDAAFAPPGGYGKLGESLVFTHGVMTGIAEPTSTDLAAATATFVEAQLRANPEFQVTQRAQSIQFGGQPGLGTVIAGPSPVTGVLEVDVVYTTLLADGRLFYVITVAPHDEAQVYQPAFERVMASVRFGS